MDAVVTKPFKGAPDGEIYPRDFNVGDKLAGDLAAVAVKEGWAIEGDKSPDEGVKSRAPKDAKTVEPATSKA